MPIYGRTPRDCYEVFQKHLASLLSAIFGPQAFFSLDIQQETATVSIWQGDKASSVAVETRSHGMLRLYAHQTLTTRRTEGDEQQSGKFRLRTLVYGYALSAGGIEDHPLLRWEFKKIVGPHPGHAIHHQHANIELPCGNGSGASLDLDKLHVPSGWVSLVSVLRFLIVDLGMHPACGDDAWPALLHTSEKKFNDNFEGRVAHSPKRKPKR